MNSEVLEPLFRAKNLRRKELAALPIADKMRLIQALHDAGMRLRKIRPQLGSFGVTARRSQQPTTFVEGQILETLSEKYIHDALGADLELAA